MTIQVLHKNRKSEAPADDTRARLNDLSRKASTLAGWERAFIRSALNTPVLSDNQVRVIRQIASRYLETIEQ